MNSVPVYPDDRLVRLRLLQRYMSAGIMSLVISRGGFIVFLLLLETGGVFIVVGRFFFLGALLIIWLSSRLCNVHHVSYLLYRLAATRSWFRRFIHHDLSGQQNNCVVHGCGVSLRSTRDQRQPRRNRRNTFHCSSAASLDGQRKGSLSRCLGAFRPALNRVGWSSLVDRGSTFITRLSTKVSIGGGTSDGLRPASGRKSLLGSLFENILSLSSLPSWS